jgi:hypothetical protein
MATTEYKEETIKLMDNSELSLRPLKISLLREFLKKFGEVEKVAEDNDKSIDVLMDCVLIALKQYKPDFSGDKAALEEIVDLPTVYKIVEVAAGTSFAGLPNFELNA